MGKRYSVSKFLNVVFTRELAAHLPATSPITLVAVNPGLCYSDLGRNKKTKQTWNDWIWRRFNARSTEYGSRSLLHGATGKDLQGIKGEFTNCGAVAEPSDLVISKEGAEIQKKAWAETISILAKVDPKITPILAEYLI